MRLLLDSHVLVGLLGGDIGSLPTVERALQSTANEMSVSAASFWELAIKFRIGKLRLARPPEKLAGHFVSLGYALLPVDHRHAVEQLQHQPPTRDPFDRMLLAQCQVEGMRLLTADRALAAHPLAWREP